ncbi:MAG: septal ring lytic transglycosylase RlpA family protein [Bacteroidetes bacterium]|nr:septal ring lytic transglycosylase RlpA family protein [Bacteroidota bacterium]
MKSQFKYAVTRCSFLLAVVFTTLCTTVHAQVADTAQKAPPLKVKKTLYGLASFYANKFNGRRTASGEIFSQNKFTCACNVLPLDTWIRVTNLHNGRTVIVKTNDRLHPRMKRIVDLSKAAATKLGYTGRGLARVKVEVLGKKPPQAN